jgi:hypothetical protein
MTVMPSALWFYDELLIFLVPKTATEAAVLSAGSWLAWTAAMLTAAHVPGGAVFPEAQPWIALGMFVPATVMVLRRPNEGDVSPWIDKRVMWMSNGFAGLAARVLNWPRFTRDSGL